MPNQKKRTAWSVQDVVNGKANNASGANPRFKSGYSGPKKSSSSVMDRINAENVKKTGTIPRERIERELSENRLSAKRRGGEDDDFDAPTGRTTPSFTAGYGIMNYAWIAYSGVLALCLIISLIVYSNGARSSAGYRYPSYIFSFNGVLNSIYDDYQNGGLGSKKAKEEAEATKSPDTDSLLGESTNSSTLPNTTTGATMALDTGSTYGSYSMATSYSELLDQLKTALEDNDFGFVGMKLAYEDEDSGELIGYPQSVVEHFTDYMSDNSGKREVFLSEIADEDTYSAKNGSAYIVKLPILKFTINMGYDNTTVSISGFADQKMDAGQSAVVSPLLPCMYTITVTTDEGSQSSEVECDMSEGNLQVNIGVTK